MGLKQFILTQLHLFYERVKRVCSIFHLAGVRKFRKIFLLDGFGNGFFFLFVFFSVRIDFTAFM